MLENYYLKSENYQSLRSRMQMINPDEALSDVSNPLRKVATGSSTSDGIVVDGADSIVSTAADATSATKPYPIQVLALISLYRTITRRPSLLELQSFLFKRQIIFRRAAHSILARPSLIVGNVLLHVILALAFAWVLETPNFNCMIAFYGIGTMFLIMANIQLIYFIYNNQKVVMSTLRRL